MNSIATWLMPLIVLTAAGAAHAQEQPALPPAASGCIGSACEPGIAQATTDKFSPPVWQSFRLPPVNRVGELLIWQEHTLFDPAQFTGTSAYPRMIPYPQVRNEQSWEQKISGIKELPLLTLWRTDGSKIFFGVNNDGFAGLNFSQSLRAKPKPTDAGPDSLSRRPIGLLSPPLAHAQSLTYQKKDLSGALPAESK